MEVEVCAASDNLPIDLKHIVQYDFFKTEGVDGMYMYVHVHTVTYLWRPYTGRNFIFEVSWSHCPSLQVIQQWHSILSSCCKNDDYTITTDTHTHTHTSFWGPTIMDLSLQYYPGLVIRVDGEGVMESGWESSKHVICIHTPRTTWIDGETSCILCIYNRPPYT